MALVPGDVDARRFGGKQQQMPADDLLEVEQGRDRFDRDERLLAWGSALESAFGGGAA